MSLFKRFINELVNFIFIIIVAVVIFIVLRQYLFQPFQVEGHSMEPELHNGDQMIMLRQMNLDRFDIVVFPDPRGFGESYVKRVIGLPGDSLAYENDQLIINGQILEEPYLEAVKANYEGQFTEDFNLRDTLGIDVIPEGTVFVLGDNRPNSGDSRQFGLIDIDDIQGETHFIYYPLDRFGFLSNYELTEDQTAIVSGD